MTDCVACDVSEYQVPVSDAYPHRWLLFRACDGDYVDHNAALNLAWARTALAAGKLDGYTVYVVYRPGLIATIQRHLDELFVPHDCYIMIDAETWGGAISGDHSAELNDLATALAARQGSQSKVWGYGNRNDLATVWPTRPSWLGVVVASYGGTKPTDIPNLIGWQYTDGLYTVDGYPSATSPFGACDHNVLFVQPPAPPRKVSAGMFTATTSVDHYGQSIPEANQVHCIFDKGLHWHAQPKSLTDVLGRVADAGGINQDQHDWYAAFALQTATSGPAPADIAKAVVAALPSTLAVSVDVNSLATAIASHVKLAPQ